MRCSRRIRLAVSVGVVTVALAGCASGVLDVEDETVGASAAPSATASPTPASPEPSSSEAPAADGIDTSDWLEYATHDGDLTYRYPEDWTIESESSLFSPDAERDDVEDPYARWMDASVLTAPNGQQLLHSSDFVDLGGACGAPESFQRIDILAIEPLAAVEATSIVTAALRSIEGRWTFGMGLVGGDVVTTDTCVFHFIAGSSDGGFFLGTTPSIVSTEEDPLWTVDTLDDAYAYMETEEYATLLEILRSVRTS